MVRAMFPGTFDPIHYGHIDIALRASKMFDEVIVAVYEMPLKNSIFAPDERIELVSNCFQGLAKIKVMGYKGLTVDFCREKNVQVIVRGLRVFSDFECEFRMALANHRLDPDVEVMAFITSEEHSFLSSSTVKEIASLGGDVSSMVPTHVDQAMKNKFQTVRENQSKC